VTSSNEGFGDPSDVPVQRGWGRGDLPAPYPEFSPWGNYSVRCRKEGDP